MLIEKAVLTAKSSKRRSGLIYTAVPGYGHEYAHKFDYEKLLLINLRDTILYPFYRYF